MILLRERLRAAARDALAAGIVVAHTIQFLLLCGMASTFTAVGVYFFGVNDQGRELLASLGERGFDSMVHRAWFGAAVASWTLVAWFSVQVTLRKRLHGSPPDTAWAKLFRRGFPAVLAVAIPAAVAWGALQAKTPWIAFFYAVFALAVAGLPYRGEEALLALLGEGADASRRAMSRRATLIARAAFLLALAAVGVIVAWPVEPARWVGTPAIVAAALAIWILVGQLFFIYYFRASRRGVPAMVIPLAIVALAFSSCNDNHEVRKTAGDDAKAARRAADARPDWNDHFERWIRDRKPGADGTVPAYVVAAQGGGLRAAYWTAAVLGHLHDRTQGAFSASVFAISGVSGGSLGATVYTTLLAAQRRGAAGGLEKQANDVLDGDFLAPTVAFMLFPDLLQRILPLPFASFDRARGLEEPWEADLRGRAGYDYAHSFLGIWDAIPADAPPLPALVLNATWVETGMRVLVSNLKLADWNPNNLDHTLHANAVRWDACVRRASWSAAAVDVFCKDLDTGALRASSAVHLSARFPYVSPAARIMLSAEGHARRAEQDRAIEYAGNTSRIWGHVVDGGYFEGSGAATAGEILDFLKGKMDRYPQLRPIVVMVTNDPEEGIAEPLHPWPAPASWATDLLAPPLALFQTRTARGADAQESLQTKTRALPAGGGSFFRIVLQRNPRNDEAAPLGWYLSRRTKACMQEALHSDLGGQVGALLSAFPGHAPAVAEKPPNCD